MFQRKELYFLKMKNKPSLRMENQLNTARDKKI